MGEAKGDRAVTYELTDERPPDEDGVPEPVHDYLAAIS